MNNFINNNSSDLATDQGLTAVMLLSRFDLIRRWRCGSTAFFHRAESEGLLVSRRYNGRLGYRWEDVWSFEGGLPPQGLEAAYRSDLVTPQELAEVCPLKPATLIRKAAVREIPHRRIGRAIRFIPFEAERWLQSWS